MCWLPSRFRWLPKATSIPLSARPDAWHWERERHLLWPWLPPSAAARRLVDAPDPARVHANVVELLRLGPRLAPLLAATTPPDLAGQLRALDLALSVSAEPANDYQGRAAALLS